MTFVWLSTSVIFLWRRRRGSIPGMVDALAASLAASLITLLVLSVPGSPIPLGIVWSFGFLWAILMIATTLLLSGTLLHFERERNLRAALAASEDRYALTVDASHEGIFDRDLRTGDGLAV
ncbi:MAG: hypothetical protein WDO24_01500 [Pseudomonadota bacterium]